MVDPAALKLVPYELCKKHRLIPVRRVDNNLIVAMADPSNLHAIDELRFVTQFAIVPVGASEVALEAALPRYHNDFDVDRPVDNVRADEASAHDAHDELAGPEQRPITEGLDAPRPPIAGLVYAILLSAI